MHKRRMWIIKRLIINNESLYYYPQRKIFSSKIYKEKYINLRDTIELYKMGFSADELACDLLKEVC